MELRSKTLLFKKIILGILFIVKGQKTTKEIT
jgi:hypothetical protein